MICFNVFKYIEFPFHKGAVQMSEVEDGPEAAILLWNEEGAAVKARPAVGRKNCFYSSFR